MPTTTKIVVAPSSAATVPVRLCQASSQISIAGTAPSGVERANFEAAIDESLLVEQPVRRQEQLAMHVPDYGSSPPSVT